jgi:hypothetical protein
MNPQQLFAEVNRRDIPRLYVACATATLLLIAAAAVLLTTFEVAVWKMKVLVRTLAPGKVQAPVRHVERSEGYARYYAHSYRWRT